MAGVVEDLNDAFNYGVVVLKPDEKLHAGRSLRRQPQLISGTYVNRGLPVMDEAS